HQPGRPGRGAAGPRRHPEARRDRQELCVAAPAAALGLDPRNGPAPLVRALVRRSPKMPATIDFLFDFGSPNGYLAWKVLPQIAERTGAGINLIPVLLGGLFKLTNNRSPVEAFGQVKGKL